MLRHRFLLVKKKLRIYAQMAISTYNKVKTAANAFVATMVKSESSVVNSLKVDSTPYEASLSNINVSSATSPSLDADNYEAQLSNADVTVASTVNMDYDCYDASVAVYDGKQYILNIMNGIAVGEAFGNYKKWVTNEVVMNAQDCDASMGDSKKILTLKVINNAVDADSVLLDIKRVQDIDVRTDALTGDAHLVDIDITTTTGASVVPVAYEKVDSELDVYEGVATNIFADNSDITDAHLGLKVSSDVSIDADLFDASTASQNTSEVCMHTDIQSEPYSATTADSSLHNSIIVTLAPVAKAVEWLDPIILDGHTLYIRQAFYATKNNDTLEVI